ncbi:MAG: hypothetical protein ACKODC_09740 [Limnohabitans sp.]
MTSTTGKRTTMKHTLTPFALFWAFAAQAHEGHGLPGAHWHATDVAGFIAAAVAAAAFLWWRGRK